MSEVKVSDEDVVKPVPDKDVLKVLEIVFSDPKIKKVFTYPKIRNFSE